MAAKTETNTKKQTDTKYGPTSDHDSKDPHTSNN